MSRGSSRFHLTPIQSHRVIALIQGSGENLSTIGAVTAESITQLNEHQKLSSSEISHLLHEQKRLEKRYAELLQERDSAKSHISKSQYKEHQDQIHQIGHDLRECTSRLCHSLQEDPKYNRTIEKIKKEREELLKVLSYTIRELMDTGTFQVLINKVNTTNHEDMKNKQNMERDKDLSNESRQIEQELEKRKNDQQKNVIEHKAIISELKAQLSELKKKKQIDMTYAEKEVKSKIETTAKMYEQAIRDEDIKLHSLQQSYNTEKAVHEEFVAFLHEKIRDLNGENEQWKRKYQEELTKEERHLQEMTEKCTHMHKHLKKLKERWENVREKEKAKENERLRLVELRELKKQEELKQTQSTITIQRVYRSYIKKKNEKLAQEKSKSKKKKKGKGKGKK